MLRWGVPLLCGGLLGALVFMFKWIRALKGGLISLLADRLGQLCRHYEDKGYCTPYGRRNATRLHGAYHGLGKNGEMTNRYNKLLQLPVRDEDI